MNQKNTTEPRLLATGKGWRLYSASGRSLQEISTDIQKNIPARLTVQKAQRGKQPS